MSVESFMSWEKLKIFDGTTGVHRKDRHSKGIRQNLRLENSTKSWIKLLQHEALIKTDF
jgi:hypothetical protein